MKRLDEIAKSIGTDKSSNIHNYCEKYEKYFPFERWENLKILEIGVLGGDSIKTWKEYYPNSTVIGIDINPDCIKYQDIKNNIFVEIGSQDDPDFLKSIVEKWGSFDMILDDGSHMNNHVIFSFIKLIDSVKPSGIYVVEDSCTSYWPEYGGAFRSPGTMMEFFKDMTDDVNFRGQLQEYFWYEHARREDFLIQQTLQKDLMIRTDIESINFLNGIIIITKR
jgi:hypothetical protein